MQDLQRVSFSVGWNPPKNEDEARRSPWETWQEFMADWLEARDEFLALEAHPRREFAPFAERLLRIYGKDGPPDWMAFDDVVEAWEADDNAAAADLLKDIVID